MNVCFNFNCLLFDFMRAMLRCLSICTLFQTVHKVAVCIEFSSPIVQYEPHRLTQKFCTDWKEAVYPIGVLHQRSSCRFFLHCTWRFMLALWWKEGLWTLQIGEEGLFQLRRGSLNNTSSDKRWRWSCISCQGSSIKNDSYSLPRSAKKTLPRLVCRTSFEKCDGIVWSPRKHDEPWRLTMKCDSTYLWVVIK